MCVSLQIFYLLNFIIFVSFSVLRLLLFSEQRFNNLILSKVLNVNLCQKLRFWPQVTKKKNYSIYLYMFLFDEGFDLVTRV